MASRLASLTVTLVGIAGLSALIAVDAAQSSRRQYATARQVMADYAALGAEGVAQRLQGVLAGRFYAMVNGVADSLPLNRAGYTRSIGSGTPLLTDAVAWVARIETNSKLRVAHFDSTIPVPANLIDSLNNAANRMGPIAYVGILVTNGELITFAKPRAGVATGIVAFPINGLHAMLQRFISNDVVLPQAITHGKKLGDGVAVSVNILTEQLANRGAANNSRFRAEQQLAVPFNDVHVQVRLAQELAPALVAGGVPQSHVPFLIGVVTVSLLLAIMAVFQLRQRERLTQLREDFVAGTSHELRTPLAQIRLFAETLRLDRVRSDDERTHALTVIEREARRLELLVENLLHTARGEQSDRGPLHFSPETLNVAALTREIVAEFAPLATKAGVVVSVENATSPLALIDAVAWRQILLNLLDNAAKYGGRGTRVVVSVVEEPKSILLIVADEGPGVPQKERARIWKKFWRGESARKTGATGTGIGLATVLDLVERHGGTCFVDDASPKGARFRVQLSKPA